MCSSSILLLWFELLPYLYTIVKAHTIKRINIHTLLINAFCVMRLTNRH